MSEAASDSEPVVDIVMGDSIEYWGDPDGTWAGVIDRLAKPIPESILTTPEQLREIDERRRERTRATRDDTFPWLYARAKAAAKPGDWLYTLDEGRANGHPPADPRRSSGDSGERGDGVESNRVAERGGGCICGSTGPGECICGKRAHHFDANGNIVTVDGSVI